MVNWPKRKGREAPFNSAFACGLAPAHNDAGAQHEQYPTKNHKFLLLNDPSVFLRLSFKAKTASVLLCLDLRAEMFGHERITWGTVESGS